MAMTWDFVRRLDPIWLNLGGKGHHHPHPQYRGYVSVDVVPSGEWSVVHDLREPIPLPDGSVERIHTEDFLHYVTRPEMVAILRECHRLLKPGGYLRIGLPDYGNPKDRPFLESGSDPRYPLHLVLTDRGVMEDILRETPFTHVEFLHAWEGSAFVERPVDYTRGMIQRTPENDRRNRSASPVWMVRNFLFRLKKGFRLRPGDETSLRGNRLHVTSLVIDCFKDA